MGVKKPVSDLVLWVAAQKAGVGVSVNAAKLGRLAGVSDFTARRWLRGAYVSEASDELLRRVLRLRDTAA